MMIKSSLVLTVLFASCAANKTQQSTVAIKCVDPAHMDTSVTPCTDFWRYAVGHWMKEAVIPAEYSSTGIDREVNERNEALLHSILESAAKGGAPKGSTSQKVGDFFASGMDEVAIEKAGLAPLQDDLARIAALKSTSELALELARLHRTSIGAGFEFGIGQDDKQSTEMIAQLEQGGLGLPEREFYLKDTPDKQTMREKYVAHIERMFALLGEKPDVAKKDAAVVMAIETDLAKASMTLVDRRDPQKTYHRLATADFVAASPGFDWPTYFGGLGLKDKNLLVHQPDFFTAFAKLAQSRPLSEWKSYLRMHLVRGAAPLLGKTFADEAFAFNGTVLRGTTEQLPRWKRVMGMTDRCLGEALGQLYVERAFTPKAKARMIELVGNLKLALANRIENAGWMAAETKKQALHKLDSIAVKIGYPDRWRDYSKLDIGRASYLANVRAARAFEFQRDLAKLGKPVDRGEWGMTPATNNAYYNPNLNEICFPAGILQPPYFDVNADDAVNYGAIGATIGHEITHGFDDEGRQYDAEGNLKDWWTEADAKNYQARAELVAKQYDDFEPVSGMHLNGKQTLGENIADLGGLLIAYDAFEHAIAGKPRALIDGFTPEQRFFLAYAESWRTKFREAQLKLMIDSDVHSPAEQRVMGPVADMPEFYAAFGCKDGEPMKRAEKLRPAIW